LSISLSGDEIYTLYGHYTKSIQAGCFLFNVADYNPEGLLKIPPFKDDKTRRFKRPAA